MSLTMDREKVTFTPRSGESWRSPWRMYQRLRDFDPVHRVVPEQAPEDDYWVLSRYADVSAAARDTATFSSAQGLTIVYGEMEAIGLSANPPLVMQDPPEHTAFRRIVAKGFTPRQVVAIEPAIRDFVVDRIESLRAQGGGDIMAALFQPLASMVVAEYLGVPEEDRGRFRAWSEVIVQASAEGPRPGSQEAASDLFAYFVELIERRKVEPGDDTVSHLLASGLDDVATLPRILGFAFTMIAGGNDTVIGLLGETARLLTELPDQRNLLLEDPTLIPAAIEELLRWTSPVQGLARTTTRDVEVSGTTIPKGRKTLLLYGSGNRDPRQFGPNSEELDLLRKPTQILTFSLGNHTCLGAAAARTQARVVLEELLARCPQFTVDSDSLEYAAGIYTRRPATVPIRTND